MPKTFKNNRQHKIDAEKAKAKELAAKKKEEKKEAASKKPSKKKKSGGK